MSASSVVVGIDVAKAHVDVAVLGANLGAQRFDNKTEATGAGGGVEAAGRTTDGDRGYRRL